MDLPLMMKLVENQVGIVLVHSSQPEEQLCKIQEVLRLFLHNIPTNLIIEADFTISVISPL